MAVVDEYALPPDVTPAYIKAPRTNPKDPSEWTLAGGGLHAAAHAGAAAGLGKGGRR